MNERHNNAEKSNKMYSGGKIGSTYELIMNKISTAVHSQQFKCKNARNLMAYILCQLTCNTILQNLIEYFE